MPSGGGAVPLLNYQPALYQQATINIPGLTQQSVPIPTRPAGLCSQTEPFQQTLIVCPPSTIQGKDEKELDNKHFTSHIWGYCNMLVIYFVELAIILCLNEA